MVYKGVSWKVCLCVCACVCTLAYIMRLFALYYSNKFGYNSLSDWPPLIYTEYMLFFNIVYISVTVLIFF